MGMMSKDIRSTIALETKLSATLVENKRLRDALQDLVDDDQTPPPNCSCNISPPCEDCIQHGGRRELISIAKEALGRKTTP
jgi:hypothetical protein